VRIRVLALFERVVHHAVVMDPTDPFRPSIEVDAIVRDGDADGPLLLPAPTFMALVGGPELADAPLRALARQGRVVDHQGVAHVVFPMWTATD